MYKKKRNKTYTINAGLVNTVFLRLNLPCPENDMSAAFARNIKGGYTAGLIGNTRYVSELSVVIFLSLTRRYL